jgi:ADP-ribose pyrophosphatase YjhB (NUDIX family)
MTDILDETLRQGGFSSEARKFPRSRRQLAMIAAFNNCRIDELPPAAHYFPTENMKTTWERVETAALQFHNFNPPNIAVGLVWVGNPYTGGVLVGRRNLPGPGFGKLCLIGGFQDMGETLKEACSREFLEETQLQLDAKRWSIWGDPVAVENNSKNLVFMHYEFEQPTWHEASNMIDLTLFKPNAEISELKIWWPENVVSLNDTENGHPDWAFPTHYAAAVRYYFAIQR